MSKEDKNSDHLELIVKYITGEAESFEREKVESWIAEKEENHELLKSYQRVWDKVDVADPFTKDRVQKEWEQLKKEMALSDESIALRTITSKTSRLLRIAAVIVFFIVTIGIAYLYLPRTGGQEIVSAETSTPVEFKDGSEVILNAFSSLEYSKNYGKEERRVHLSGEAFFDIERDEEKPFIIEVFETEVEVLGTSFNIRAYEETGSIQVVVQSGIVKFSTPDTSVVLQAGDRGVYAMDDKMIIKSVNEDVNYLSWKTRKLVFDNMELKDIVEVINKVYHSDIQIGNSELSNCTLSTIFENQSLEGVLEIITSTLDLEFEKAGDQYILKGDGC
jgi:ferric-dicitrate binding protein FerR (iron transport regulator)